MNAVIILAVLGVASVKNFKPFFQISQSCNPKPS